MSIEKQAEEYLDSRANNEINELYETFKIYSGKPSIDNHIPRLVKLLVRFMRKYKHTKYSIIEQLSNDIQTVLDSWMIDMFEEELDKVVDGVASELHLK